MVTFNSVKAVRGAVGVNLGTSDWILIGQERIDSFAECTEDRQWIHVDPVRAASGPFESPIAHGYLTLSLASRILDDLISVENVDAAVNYGLNKVRYPAPVIVGSQVRGRGTLLSVEDVPDGIQVAIALVIESDSQAKPVCVAETLTRYLGSRQVSDRTG